MCPDKGDDIEVHGVQDTPWQRLRRSTLLAHVLGIVVIALFFVPREGQRTDFFWLSELVKINVKRAFAHWNLLELLDRTRRPVDHAATILLLGTRVMLPGRIAVPVAGLALALVPRSRLPRVRIVLALLGVTALLGQLVLLRLALQIYSGPSFQTWQIDGRDLGCWTDFVLTALSSAGLLLAIPGLYAIFRRRGWWPLYFRVVGVVAFLGALPSVFSGTTQPLLVPQQALALGVALVLEAREFPFSRPNKRDEVFTPSTP